jgi:hypothetical protein
MHVLAVAFEHEVRTRKQRCCNASCIRTNVLTVRARMYCTVPRKHVLTEYWCKAAPVGAFTAVVAVAFACVGV